MCGANVFPTSNEGNRSLEIIISSYKSDPSVIYLQELTADDAKQLEAKTKQMMQRVNKQWLNHICDVQFRLFLTKYDNQPIC